MSNAERFIDAYAIIERKMSEFLKISKYVSFSQMLDKAAAQNRVIASNQQSLREYNSLRNAIVHNRGKDNEVIAEPCDSVTEDIERIARLLDLDDNILQFASKPVKTINPETTIEKAFEMMDELKTSKIPVYKDGAYKGVVTLEEIARWGVMKDDEKKNVRDILVAHKNEKVLFLAKSATYNSAILGFEKAMKNGNSLLAIIITEKGRLDEVPLGIITVADLPKILATFA